MVETANVRLSRDEEDASSSSTMQKAEAEELFSCLLLCSMVSIFLMYGLKTHTAIVDYSMFRVEMW